MPVYGRLGASQDTHPQKRTYRYGFTLVEKPKWGSPNQRQGCSKLPATLSYTLVCMSPCVGESPVGILKF